MGDLFTAPHLLFLGVVVLVLFGGKKLPELGKGLGEGLRGFKDGMKGINEDDTEAKKKEEDDAAAKRAAQRKAELEEEAILARREARLADQRKSDLEASHNVTPRPEEVTK